MQDREFEVLIDVARSETIDVPVARVWALVSDPIRHPEWSDELQEVRLLDGHTAPGARFVGRNRIEGFGDWITEPLEWETTSTVSEADECRRFSWIVGDTDDPVARWRFDLEDRGGSTVLQHRAQIHPRGLARTIGENPGEAAMIIQERKEILEGVLREALDRIRMLLDEG